MNEKQLLRDPETEPTENVISDALGGIYTLYADFINKLPSLNISTEWRYYNDGKSWLGKNIYKKKNLFWLSVWEGYFQISMFFTEKTGGGVSELPIADEFKKFEPLTGKLKAIIIKVRKDADLNDLFTLIEYKRDLK